MSDSARIIYPQYKPSGCFWYRTKQPMDMLNVNGIKTASFSIGQDISNDFEAVQLYGAYPFSVEHFINQLKADGKKIIYDTDDALDLIDLSNPQYYTVKKDAGSATTMMELADEITVSCPAMREYVVSKIGESKPITVVPNCYTPSEWTFPRPKREGIRIGYAGSSTHVKDLIDIIPVITKLKEKYPIKFIIMGFGGEDYQTWYKHFRYTCTPEATKLLEELDKNLAKLGDFEWVPFIDYDKYPTSLINMALDIGLCPLKETPFDRCRTACKAMEYTLSGALALASDVTAYRNDHNSVLVKDNEWEKVIEHYIQNPLDIDSEHASHLKWTQENRNIISQLGLLKKIYGIPYPALGVTPPPRV